MELGSIRTIAPDEAKDVKRRVSANHAEREHHGETAPAAPRDSIFLSTPKPTKTVKMSYLPQDPGMLPPRQAEVDATELKEDLEGPRVKISVPRHFPMPQADEQGNYIFGVEDPRFDPVQSYVGATRALGLAEKWLGRELHWGFSEDLGRDQLLIRPHAGQGVMNAFYSSDAGSLNFFSFTDPKTQETHRTGMSADIVAHEAGHAILDALRHQYLGSLSVSAGGFHESFGDMMSMLSALADDAVIDKLYAETKGDLSKPNLVAKNAEMLGVAIGRSTGKSEDALRNANNGFKYADPHFLPYYDKKNPNGGMGQEAHAYSNLFTGAFYDIIREAYNEAAKDSSKTFKQAIGEARETAGRLLFRGTEFAPVGDPSYREVALAMIKADAVDNSGKNRPLLEKVFTDRLILTREDLSKYDEHEKSLPALVLSDTDKPAVQSEQGAMAFLDAHRKELGVPEDTAFEYVDTITNKRGETILQFGFNAEIALDEPDYGFLEGSRARTNGGLLLAFDREGKLIANNFDDITEREIEDICDHLKVVVANGGLSFAAGNPHAPHANEDGAHLLHVVQSPGPNGPVLERSRTVWG